MFIPDILKSRVDRSRGYDPDLDRAYAEFAERYGVAHPPGASTPRDKSRIEAAVQIVERWILAR